MTFHIDNRGMYHIQFHILSRIEYIFHYVNFAVLIWDTNDCVDVRCLKGGTCEDGFNAYTCLCNTGFEGDHCQTSRFWWRGKRGTYYQQNRYKIFTFSHCSELDILLTSFSIPLLDINDCADVLCQNGGICEDGVNSYNCHCVTGFEGDHCRTSMF